MPDTPPSSGSGSVTLDYFNAILHALLPSLDPSETPPQYFSTRQLDYLNAIWQATLAQQGVLSNKVDRWEAWNNDFIANGDFSANNNSYLFGDVFVGNDLFLSNGDFLADGSARFSDGAFYIDADGTLHGVDWYINPDGSNNLLGGGGGDLQTVTDAGNITTNPIIVQQVDDEFTTMVIESNAISRMWQAESYSSILFPDTPVSLSWQLPNISGEIVVKKADGTSQDRPYKVYKALVTIEDEITPIVVEVLENNIGALEFGITDIGKFNLLADGNLFINNKTAVIIGSGKYIGSAISIDLINEASSESALVFEARELITNNLTNYSCLKRLIEIRVYN